MQSDFAPCVVPWSGMGHSGLEMEWRVARDGRGGEKGNANLVGKIHVTRPGIPTITWYSAREREEFGVEARVADPVGRWSQSHGRVDAARQTHAAHGTQLLASVSSNRTNALDRKGGRTRRLGHANAGVGLRLPNGREGGVTDPSREA